MATPEKNTVSYWPHPTEHGRKMYYIENKYGNDGYTTWMKILEQLGRTHNHYIDLSDDTTSMYLSSQCRIEEPKLILIVQDLVKLGEVDKELWEKKSVIYVESFVESILHAYRRRNRIPLSIDHICRLFGLNGRQEPKKERQPDVDSKHSIVYKNTIDKIIKEKELSFEINDEFIQSWVYYMEMRQRIRKPATDRAKELVLIKLEKLSVGNIEHAIQILDQSVEFSYQGVFPLKKQQSDRYQTDENENHEKAL